KARAEQHQAQGHADRRRGGGEKHRRPRPGLAHGAARRATGRTRLKMRDYLAWRLAFGVATPSTNTVVQPEYDDMRPPGATNHLARMATDDIPVRSNEDFEELLRLIDLSLEDAVARAMDAKPNAFILGISALSVWGGTPQWGEDLKKRIRAVAKSDIPV